MRSFKKSVTRIKKFLTSVVVLLIFLFPMVVSLRWLHEVAFGNDPRNAYSQADVAAFGQDCPADEQQVRPFDEPLVTITFDDGWESIYSEGLKVLEEHCVKTTQYVLGGHFDDILYLSEDQVDSLQRAGHEIASHTMTHRDLTKLSKADMAWELDESGRILSEKYGKMREFASPLGATNDAVLEHIKKQYRSHRNTTGDPKNGVADIDINVRETFDRYNINAYTISQETTPEDIRALIDHTVKRKGWLILTYHQVEDGDAYYAVDPATLSKQLQIVNDSGLPTPTMGQVLDALERDRL